MARIKINDLPKDIKINKTELRGIFGGLETESELWPAQSWAGSYDTSRPMKNTIPFVGSSKP